MDPIFLIVGGVVVVALAVVWLLAFFNLVSNVEKIREHLENSNKS